MTEAIKLKPLEQRINEVVKIKLDIPNIPAVLKYHIGKIIGYDGANLIFEGPNNSKVYILRCKAEEVY